MKKIFGILACCFFLFTFSAFGANWAVISNHVDCTIQTIDLSTDPATIYGPFLANQLGTAGLNDLALTPDGKYALVSSYYGGILYRIDITDPTNPTLAGSIAFPVIPGAPDPYYFTPQDIAVAPNGNFAVISSGRSLLIPPQPPTNMFAIIDLTTFTFTTTYTLTTTNGSAQAIAIAGDNQTVIMADRAGGSLSPPYPGRIIYGVINPATGLTSESTLPTGINSYPINVTISPDGQTVLISGNTDYISVFQITGPGIVVPGTPATVLGLPGRQQSIAFSPDGQKAYALSTTPVPHLFSWLQITGPGVVNLGGASVATLFTSGKDYRLLGVDVVAVTPDNNFALVTNPSQPGDTTSRNVALVNLSTFAVSSIPTDSNYPMGVACFDFEVETCPYDLDDNGIIDIVDIMMVAARWNTFTGDPNYNELCDLNDSGSIDIVDIMTVAAHWGESCNL